MSSILKYWDYLLISFISLFLVVIWFHTGLIEGGAEEGLAFYDPYRTYLLSTSVWWEYNGGFPTLAWLPHSNTFFLLGILFRYLHFSNGFLQAGTFFVLLLTGSFSVYLLTKDLTKGVTHNRVIASVASIFYILNPYSMSQVWGRALTAQYFAFALLPLSIFLFIKGMREKNLVYAFWLGITSLLFSSAYGLTTFVIVYWSVLVTIYIFWFLIGEEQKRKSIFFYIRFLVTFLILWIVFNFYWFFPTIISGQSIYSNSLTISEDNVGTLLSVSQYFTFPTIIRLLQDFFFFNPGTYGPVYGIGRFQAISIMLPLFLFIGIVAITFKKEFRNLRVILILFIVGLVVSLGANPPFGSLFVTVFKEIPYLQGFRNPYEKFGIVYAVSYAPLFAVGLVYLFKKLLHNNKLQSIGITFVMVIICGYYVWPMWTGLVVAGSDKKLGLQVPSAYVEIDNFFRLDGSEAYRVAMMPFWPGEAAFYQWGTTQYAGIDPTMYLSNVPTISSIPTYFPYFSDIFSTIRRTIYQNDNSGALALLRVKFLVNRNDAINISHTDKLHYQYLTAYRYPPNKFDSLENVICEDRITSPGQGVITCELEQLRNLSSIKYLHVVIKVDVSSTLDIAIRDVDQNRPNWSGRTYPLKGNEWNTILVPLGIPNGNNNATDYAKIIAVDISAHPDNQPDNFVEKIELRGIWLDPGIQQKNENYHFIKAFGDYQVYEAKKIIFPPEFGLLSNLETVSDIDRLLVRANEKRNSLESTGIIVSQQNKNKETNVFNKNSEITTKSQKKISDTKYWIQLEDPGHGNIILSKTFNTQWKVLPGVKKEALSGGIFNELTLIKSSFLDENTHYVVNGYANLWRINGESQSYAVVFLPQIYADLGLKISIISIIILLGICLLQILITKINKNKRLKS